MATGNVKPSLIKVDHVETVHVNYEGQKLACICLVLQDSPSSYKMKDSVSVLNRMVITDVVPQKSNAEKSDIYFRNLNNREVIYLGSKGALPIGSVTGVFANFLDTHVLTEDGSLVRGETVSSEEGADIRRILGIGHHAHDIQAEYNAEQQLIGILAQVVNDIPEQQEQRLYKTTVSTAEAHLGQLLHNNTNSPAFIFTTGEDFSSLKNKEKQSIENYTLLEFPLPNTSEYYDTTASLTQAITGVYQLNVSTNSMNRIRGLLLNSILRISYGDNKGLIDAFSKVNPIRKALLKVKERSQGVSLEKPTVEDMELCYYAEAVNRIYSFTSPENIAAIIQEEKPSDEFLNDIETIKSLFSDTDLSETFNELIENHSKGEINFLMPPKAGDSVEEIVSYYSAPVTLENLPENMRPLIQYLEMPLLFEDNWAQGEIKTTETDTNASEIVLAKLITVAIRYARLKIIGSPEVKSNINPIGCLIRGMTYPQESLFWVHSEAVKTLATTFGKKIFKEIFIESMGVNLVSRYDLGYLMNTSLGFMLHRVGHQVLDEQLTPEQVAFLLKDSPILNKYFENIYKVESFTEDSDDEEEGDEFFEEDVDLGDECSPTTALVALFMTYVSSSDIVQLGEELADFLIALAELSVQASTDLKAGTKEWKKLMSDYLSDILSPNEH